MDHLIDIALVNGAIAPKVCGAGGGGCIAFYCESERVLDVETALASEEEVTVLDFNIQNEGLQMNLN